MDEEPVYSRGKGIPRSTMMVLVLGSVALLLCTASALVGGVFLGAVVFQSNGFTNSEAAGEGEPAAPIAPTMVPRPGTSDMVPTVPAPVPSGGMNADTPLPFDDMPTTIP